MERFNDGVLAVNETVAEMHPKLRDTWTLVHETRQKADTLLQWTKAIHTFLPVNESETRDIQATVNEMHGWMEQDGIVDTVNEMHCWMQESSMEETVNEIHTMLEEAYEPEEDLTHIRKQVGELETMVENLTEGLQDLRQGQDRIATALADVHKEIQRSNVKRNGEIKKIGDYMRVIVEGIMSQGWVPTPETAAARGFGC